MTRMDIEMGKGGRTKGKGTRNIRDKDGNRDGKRRKDKRKEKPKRC